MCLRIALEVARMCPARRSGVETCQTTRKRTDSNTSHPLDKIRPIVEQESPQVFNRTTVDLTAIGAMREE